MSVADKPMSSYKRAEIKSRTWDNVKTGATEVYARWGLTLNDAINIFLVKSIEVGGLPFDMRPEMPSYDQLKEKSHKAPLNSEGVAILPSEWAGDE